MTDLIPRYTFEVFTVASMVSQRTADIEIRCMAKAQPGLPYLGSRRGSFYIAQI